jgi:hypothetical protein
MGPTTSKRVPRKNAPETFPKIKMQNGKTNHLGQAVVADLRTWDRLERPPEARHGRFPEVAATPPQDHPTTPGAKRQGHGQKTFWRGRRYHTPPPRPRRPGAVACRSRKFQKIYFGNRGWDQAHERRPHRRVPLRKPTSSLRRAGIRQRRRLALIGGSGPYAPDPNLENPDVGVGARAGRGGARDGARRKNGSGQSRSSTRATCNANPRRSR